MGEQLMSWHLLLDLAAGLLVIGLLCAGIYEVVAIVNTHISATPNIPLITDIVRPWVMANKMWALAIAAVIFAAFFWLFFHFYLPK